MPGFLRPSQVQAVPPGLLALAGLAGAALAQQPLKIGFGMSLTGPLAGNGKAALIAGKVLPETVTGCSPDGQSAVPVSSLPRTPNSPVFTLSSRVLSKR